ncbi:MAG: YkgJ family cysteine cluster protein [Candidatus Melainabacteria bacterium]|nr:YkgJ family cysteine cluster protein [Candidatus Melainabacteria bacterium]
MVDKLPWYKDGLKFKCTGCGKCCTGFPGTVWVSDEEIEALAKTLNISPEEFARKYTRRIGNRLSLKEHARTYSCVFLDGKKCTVYDARPKQCRTFPWWSENLDSPEEWKETASNCEGIDSPDAPLISLDEIQKHF